MRTSLKLLVAGLALLVLNPLLHAQVSFAPVINYVVGKSPYCVVAADINGNGKLDLISANSGANTLTVLTNNGSGVFGSNATLNVGSGPDCVVAADINSDGKLDLISANSGANTLTVLTNNGKGVFGSNATFNVGSYPNFVVVADVNGDGKADLVSCNAGTYPNPGTLTVLTNNGSGSFGSNATLNVDSGPGSPVAADINGDGKTDLMCVNFYSSTLTVFTNNGSGSFGFNASYNVDSEPTSLVAADVNGDGNLDLISANWGGSTLTLLTNNGSGVFGLYATLAVNAHPRSVVAADVTGDGKPELFRASLVGILSVLINNGSGGFGFGGTLLVGSTPWSVVAADVNRDGRLDLICANSGNNTVSVLTNSLIYWPSLNIKCSSNNAVVSWQSSWTASTGWTLQQNTSLNPADWIGFSGTIGDDGATKTVTNSFTTGNLFFRLSHP